MLNIVKSGGSGTGCSDFLRMQSSARKSKQNRRGSAGQHPVIVLRRFQMKINKKYKAKAISYDSINKRKRKDIKYIVIHYTGNDGDTAQNNAKYFATSNTREAGAHFFVGRAGKVYRSIPMNRTAWAVGGVYTTSNGAGSYYKKCTNYNSVSIELCDIASKDPGKKQKTATKKLVKRIKKRCPNATTIIRHWDVNGKSCPARMAGKNNAKWTAFKKAIQ